MELRSPCRSRRDVSTFAVTLPRSGSCRQLEAYVQAASYHAVTQALEDPLVRTGLAMTQTGFFSGTGGGSHDGFIAAGTWAPADIDCEQGAQSPDGPAVERHCSPHSQCRGRAGCRSDHMAADDGDRGPDQVDVARPGALQTSPNWDRSPLAGTDRLQ